MDSVRPEPGSGEMEMVIAVLRGGKVLEGKDAPAVLGGLGLPSNVLGKLWEAADSDQKGSLTAGELLGLLRVAAHAQAAASPDAFFAEHDSKGALITLGRAGPGPSLAKIDGIEIAPPPAAAAPAAAPAPVQPPPAAPATSPPPPAVGVTPKKDWILSDAKREKYKGSFAKADTDKDGLVNGGDAKHVFMRSKLDPKVLGQIWQLCDLQKRGSLDLNEWTVAMFLINRVMSKKEIPSLQEGVPESLWRQIRENLPEKDVKTHVKTVKRTPSHHQTLPAMSEWSMSKADLDKYASFFSRADADNDGFVTGAEAKPLFVKSGLSTEILGKIWFIADVTQDGKLNKQEFAIAMHLVNGSLKQRPLPETGSTDLTALLSSAGIAPRSVKAAQPAQIEPLAPVAAPTPAAVPVIEEPAKPAEPELEPEKPVKRERSTTGSSYDVDLSDLAGLPARGFDGPAAMPGGGPGAGGFDAFGTSDFGKATFASPQQQQQQQFGGGLNSPQIGGLGNGGFGGSSSNLQSTNNSFASFDANFGGGATSVTAPGGFASTSFSAEPSADLQRQRQEQEASLAKNRAEAAALQERVAGSNQANELLQAQIAKGLEQLEDDRQLLAKLQAELTEKQEEHEELKAKNAKIEAELADVRNQRREALAEIDALRAAKKDTKGAKAELKSELASAKTELAAAQEEKKAAADAHIYSSVKDLSRAPSFGGDGFGTSDFGSSSFGGAPEKPEKPEKPTKPTKPEKPAKSKAPAAAEESSSPFGGGFGSDDFGSASFGGPAADEPKKSDSDGFGGSSFGGDAFGSSAFGGEPAASGSNDPFAFSSDLGGAVEDPMKDSFSADNNSKDGGADPFAFDSGAFGGGSGDGGFSPFGDTGASSFG